MTNKPRKGKPITRRGLLPILGSSLLMPFIGFGLTETQEELPIDDLEEEYQTLLKPDGTTVKVKASTLRKAKVVEKNVSNNSFLNWLGKKL